MSIAIDMTVEPVNKVLVLEDRFSKVFGDLVITPHFQPIIDLISAAPIGYEILSRGSAPYQSPLDMFSKAREEDLVWELDKVCRLAAIKRISNLPDEIKVKYFFMNVSPDIFSDDRFIKGFTISQLKTYGIDQKKIVIEITEDKEIGDYGLFENLVGHYVGQGFKIAIDDFGSGHSGLINLIVTVPHFLKLDKMIVQDIHLHPYKQHLVKSLVSLASSLSTKLIAEGVEKWEELEVLFRLGIRIAQGFLFCKPLAMPVSEIPSDIKSSILERGKVYNFPKVDMDETITNMVIHTKTIQAQSMTCRELDNLLRKTPNLEHIVVLREQKPVGLITRQYFYSSTGGPFGFSLLQNKYADLVCKMNTLVIQDKATVSLLAKLAMERFPEDQYDPAIVVDEKGAFLGTITMKQIIQRSVEVELQNALGSNPLTNLPGNRIIEKWIREAVEHTEYTIIYADLDKFKEYNDTYGFLLGDEIIKLTARVLSKWADSISPGAKLGHIGGDDFVIVCKGGVFEETLQQLCEEFDEEKLGFFQYRDINRGYYYSVDRNDNEIKVPLITLSLAVIHSSSIGPNAHPAMLAQYAASLKKKIKVLNAEIKKSGFLFERRNYKE